MHSPDQNVERNRQLLLERSIAGLQKYGVTTERGDLTLNQWLQHLLEELLDGANYIQAAMVNSEPSTVHLGANQATIETGSMLNPAGEEVATLTIANGGTEVRLSFQTKSQASLLLHALVAPTEYRVVPTDGLRRVHRDMDACQKVIWLAGCQPRVPNGFDPSYVTDAQARLAEIDQWLEAQHP